MEINLLRLVFNYSKSGKLVDKEYIEKLIETVVSSKSLDKYICKLQILSEKQGSTQNGISLASYNPFSKIISVYSSGINEMLEHYDRYQVLFNNAEQIFYKNLLISQVILHEIEHANQRRIVDNEKNLESEILKLSISQIDFDSGIKLLENGYSIKQVMSYILSKQVAISENYNIAPNERLAEIKSYQEILKVLSHIKEYVPNLIEFEKTNKLENLLRGFDYNPNFILSPTVSYLQQIGNSEALNHFDWYDKNYLRCLEKSKINYSLEDRLKYGLMIDENEFNYCSEVLQLSKKYNC